MHAPHTQTPDPQDAKQKVILRLGRARPALSLGALAAMLLLTAGAMHLLSHAGPRSKSDPLPSTLAELLLLPPTRFSQVPIQNANLLCATCLSGRRDPDIDLCTNQIVAWARRVQSETARHQYRYQRNPAEFENSPGFFKMLMLAVVLEEDYRVHYDARRTAGPADTRTNDGFFSDPRSVFLHGLLGPERVGTCSSLPVLFVAVGRELGYPLKLVTTKGHLFVRWEGQGERFNIEATGRGLNRFDDEYYRHWPFEISRAEEDAEGYLKSLAPSQELAVFLSVRGMCLREAGRLPEAVESFAAAVRLAPQCQSYQNMLATLQRALRHRTEDSSIAETHGGKPPNSKL